MKYGSLKNKIGLVILISLFNLTACEEYLEIPMPTNSVTTETVYNNVGTINQLMNNMYNNWAETAGPAQLYSRSVELFSDNAYNPTGTVSYPESTGTLTTADGQFSDYFWKYCYKVIYHTNLLLEGLPAATLLDENTRNAYLGAALTLRASSHFYLVRNFGDVPLVLTTDLDANSAVSRNPATEVYAQVIKDLTDAMGLLPETGTNNKRYITNKYMPQALLARVYTTMGKWPEAEAAASAVIGSVHYKMVSNLSEVFRRTSPEVISSMGNIWSSSPKYQNATILGNSLLPTAVWAENSSPALSEDLLNKFEKGDNRKTSWTILKNAGKYSNPNNRYFCNKYISYSDPAYTAGIPAGKEEDFVFIRLAEMYLIRAEARAQQGKPGAADDLNVVRNRAGLANTTSTSKTDLVNAVIMERRFEFFHEGGYRWDDLVRTGTADAVIKALPWKINWKSHQTVFPIGISQLRLDQNLTQTPGY